MSYETITLIDRLWLKSWWVILFLLACYFFYEHGIERREANFAKLQQQYLELQNEKKKALAIQKDLILQVNSQSDPEWVQLTLMKGLGLVPEGQVKVIFK